MSKNPFHFNNQFIQLNSNDQSLNLNNIRDKIRNLVEKFLNNFFEDKYFEVGEKQEWINNICNGIIKEISEILNGFKIICVGYIVQKGNAPFFLILIVYGIKKLIVLLLFNMKMIFYIVFVVFLLLFHNIFFNLLNF